MRAAFWESSTDDIVGLGLLTGIGTVTETATAAINEPDGDSVEAVGWNETADLAYIWRRDSEGDWSWADLNDISWIGNNDWILREAHDINNDGVITGWGLRQSDSIAEHAFVLVPYTDTCPADLTDDGTVGVYDLIQLLGAYGPCDDCLDCPSDLTGDCVVGDDDLDLLLEAWGACPGTSLLSGGASTEMLINAVCAHYEFESWGECLLWLSTASAAEFSEFMETLTELAGGGE